MGYGFVRDTNTWGVNSIPLDFWKQQGINPLFQAGDTNLASALARSGGGIWAAAQNGESPQAYAQRLAQLANQYHPSILVPDVEFVGKGYKGSAGWNWNDAMMAAFRALAPNQKLGLTTMPNQDDFNYGAYLNRGVTQFLPQSYGETYATKFDPQGVVNTLIRNGVPANMVQPVLAPGQSYGGQSSRYALDDWGTSGQAQTAQPSQSWILNANPVARAPTAAEMALHSTPGRVVARQIGNR
jgi:hypothetical protein